MYRASQQNTNMVHYSVFCMIQDEFQVYVTTERIDPVFYQYYIQ